MPLFRPTRTVLAAGGLAASLLVAHACSSGPSEPKGPGAELTSLPRDLTLAEQKVVGAASAFSFALWGELNAAQRDSNVFVSPLSASLALGMTLNGAASQTFDEMRAALQVGGASQQEINEGYQSLIALLASLDPAVTMEIGNSIWYRNGFPFLPAFLDAGRTYFDAEIRGLNFADAAGSLATINGWVDTKTRGKIPTILDRIDSNDVMFLINAIYFNGSWRTRFDPAKTRDETFHASGGATQPVKLMHRADTMLYAQSPTWQAVDLPYGNSAFTMTVVLPKTGTDVETLAASLTPATWKGMTESFAQTKVELALPKLKLSYEDTLNDDLKALGMRAAFVPDGADFTNMSPMGRQLFIQFVKQKTFVDVHEEGTEAAAVTVVAVGVTSAPIIPVVRVDRPYVFAIRERFSGTVLFMGKIVRMPS